MPPRIYPPLDALRGSIIVLMALDHANRFISHGKREFELWYFLFPVYEGDSLAFLTRFVTHMAAPGFFLLMGVGMALFTISRGQRDWTKWRIAQHFLLRGALLIVFQFAIENPAWDIGQNLSALNYFGVLFALGGAMILGSLLVMLPTKAVLSLSLLLILTTQAILPAAPPRFATFPAWQLLLYVPGFGDVFVPKTLVLYPILPWLGVMGLGIVYGRFLHKSPQQTYKYTGYLAVAALCLFTVIRLVNNYGNIRPIPTDDWIGFFNVVKYPPSLAFLSLSLGFNLSFLWLFWQTTKGTQHTGISEEKATKSDRHPIAKLQILLSNFLSTFGCVPLFFYFTHLYLYGFLGLWLNHRYGKISIAQMYPYWLLGLLVLWPACWAYGRFKEGRSDNSLWRFL